MSGSENQTDSIPRDLLQGGGPEGPRQPVLVVLDGPNLHARYPIEKVEVIVGRDASCDIALGDSACSRCHMKISFDDGEFTSKDVQNGILTDLGSTNGTFVNGARVGSVVLANGDRIMLGKTLLGFYIWEESTLKAEEALIRSATVDALTGLYNRSYFNDAVSREFQRARRYGRLFSLVIVDIDGFDSLQEAHGKEVVDHVLRQVAMTVRELTRQDDIVCRFGVHEIAVLLPETAINGALSMANRACESFRDDEVRVGQKAIKLTLSGGVGELQPWMREPEEVLNAATKALQTARQQGCDRVAWDAGLTEESAATACLKPGVIA